LTLKVRILAFSMTFTQLTARINNFLVGWLLFWGLKEGLVECAIVCVKSWVILKDLPVMAKENYSDFQYKNIHFEKKSNDPLFLSE